MTMSFPRSTVSDGNGFIVTVAGTTYGGAVAWMLSSDSHVMEPPDLWRGAPPQFAHIAPRVEFGGDADWWPPVTMG